MQIVSRKTLKAFWEKHPRAEEPLAKWMSILRKAHWRAPADVKAEFGASVDFVRDNRAIFDIGGNKYRVVGHISYEYKSVLIKFIGTHREYDRIDPETV